jgi:hypothetical protein
MLFSQWLQLSKSACLLLFVVIEIESRAVPIDMDRLQYGAISFGNFKLVCDERAIGTRLGSFFTNLDPA